MVILEAKMHEKPIYCAHCGAIIQTPITIPAKNWTHDFDYIDCTLYSSLLSFHLEPLMLAIEECQAELKMCSRENIKLIHIQNIRWLCRVTAFSTSE